LAGSFVPVFHIPAKRLVLKPLLLDLFRCQQWWEVFSPTTRLAAWAIGPDMRQVRIRLTTTRTGPRLRRLCMGIPDTAPSKKILLGLGLDRHRMAECHPRS
jgi:hypothetical protein